MHPFPFSQNIATSKQETIVIHCNVFFISSKNIKKRCTPCPLPSHLHFLYISRNSLLFKEFDFVMLQSEMYEIEINPKLFFHITD